MNVRRLASTLIVLCLGLALCGCAQEQSDPQASGSATASAVGSASPETPAAPAATDYAQTASWAHLETDAPATDTNADVFFICPSVYGGADDACNMSLADEETKESFIGAINMEKGIYDQDAAESDNRFFAPYYQQIGLNVYELPEAEREPYLKIAYADVKAAFEYYLAYYNDGRPIILAGFSQGADLCIRLMKDLFDDPVLQEQLVACYAIGWRVTADEVEQHPQLKMAQGESDAGVIVSFNSESPDTDDSLVVPEGEKTLAINPLNWKTDDTPADRSENEGACFTDYSGSITSEIPELTGAYIDDARGTLKVTDVTPDDYPAGLSIFEDGVYHLYDYQFFYRNLQENVQVRLDTYLDEAA